MSDKVENKTLHLQRIEKASIEIPIEGMTPLIPHAWSEKAKRLMREKHSGVAARAKKEPQDPEKEALDSLYLLSDGRPGMPAVAFKAAIVGAARFFEGVTLVQLKACIFVVGEEAEQLVPIVGERTLREDTPRNAKGVVDLRYRYSFMPWSAVLNVIYMPTLVDAQSVLALVDAAGSGGVGDWRPSAPKSLTGSFGTFKVSDTDVDEKPPAKAPAKTSRSRR
jgi:hypothetical protein